ncbi:MAG: very short patch repair endonuclease [Syntrophomonadaceae bacterium]|nr:very short patch repair endonuclease [Syntrophomonadaceae bacterium]
MPRMSKVTHKIMSAVMCKNTRPELALRRALWARGLRYRVNVKTLPGKPDVVFTKAKIALFCDGDFWHGHNWAIRGLGSLEEELERYSQFWKDKILGNIRRDKENSARLKADGWTVIRFWESDIKNNVNKCTDIVEKIYRDVLMDKTRADG